MIDAKFTADFSQFETAVKAASGTLKKLEGDASSASAQVAKMSDAAAGRFTVTTKTMQAAGIATQGWAKDLNRFDGVLSAVGVNISSQTRAIGELSAAAGQTATSMGLLGTAGLAAGAALAGWQLGRLIAEVFDLDTKIANLNGSIDKLRAQEKGAGLDVLANASRIAKKDITDFAEALRIVNQAHADHTLAMGFSTNAAGEAGAAYAKMYGEIRTVRERGDLPALQQQLTSYDFSLQTLSTRFGVHVETLELYRKTLKQAADQERDRAKALEANKKALDDLIKADWAGVLKNETGWLTQENTALQKNLDLFNKRTLAEWNAQALLGKRQGFDEKGNAIPAAGSMEAATAQYQSQLAALQASGSGGPKQEEELFQQYLENFQKAADAAGTVAAAHTDAAQAGGQVAGAMAGTAGAVAQAGQAIQNAAAALYTGFQNQFTQMGFRNIDARLRTERDKFTAYAAAGVPVIDTFPGAYHAPGRAAGGPVSSGSPYWVGERGPELFTPNTSGGITPGGGSPVTVNVSGVLLSNDPGARAQLATVIDDAIMRSLKARGRRFGST